MRFALPKDKLQRRLILGFGGAIVFLLLAIILAVAGVKISDSATLAREEKEAKEAQIALERKEFEENTYDFTIAGESNGVVSVDCGLDDYGNCVSAKIAVSFTDNDCTPSGDNCNLINTKAVSGGKYEHNLNVSVPSFEYGNQEYQVADKEANFVFERIFQGKTREIINKKVSVIVAFTPEDRQKQAELRQKQIDREKAAEAERAAEERAAQEEANKKAAEEAEAKRQQDDNNAIVGYCVDGKAIPRIHWNPSARGGANYCYGHGGYRVNN